MSIHKITVTANAVWFSLGPENNASWVLPKDQSLLFSSKGGKASIGVIRLGAKEIMVESNSTDSTNFDLELYVETDEANLAVVVDTDGTVTVNSDVDQHAAGPNMGRFSLRLI